MAEKGTAIVHKPEDESSRPPNPLLSIISKLTEVFNFRFPPPPAVKDAVKVETESNGTGDANSRSSEVAEVPKPASVRFPDARTTTLPPLKLEAEEMEQDTNPIVLWQVYAIGGFFVLRWVLARWNERRGNKKSSNEDSSPPPPPSSQADEAND